MSRLARVAAAVLLLIAAPAFAGFIYIAPESCYPHPGAGCSPVTSHVSGTHNYGTASCAVGQAIDCTAALPDDYNNINAANVGMDWFTQTADTTNKFCPQASITIVPGNASINYDTVTLAPYVGVLSQASTGTFNLMHITIGGLFGQVPIANASHSNNQCTAGDAHLCDGQSAIISFFRQDCGTFIGAPGNLSGNVDMVIPETIGY